MGPKVWKIIINGFCQTRFLPTKAPAPVPASAPTFVTDRSNTTTQPLGTTNGSSSDHTHVVRTASTGNSIKATTLVPAFNAVPIFEASTATGPNTVSNTNTTTKSSFTTEATKKTSLLATPSVTSAQLHAMTATSAAPSVTQASTNTAVAETAETDASPISRPSSAIFVPPFFPTKVLPASVKSGSKRKRNLNHHDGKDSLPSSFASNRKPAHTDDDNDDVSILTNGTQSTNASASSTSSQSTNASASSTGSQSTESSGLASLNRRMEFLSLYDGDKLRLAQLIQTSMVQCMSKNNGFSASRLRDYSVHTIREVLGGAFQGSIVLCFVRTQEMEHDNLYLLVRCPSCVRDGFCHCPHGLHHDHDAVTLVLPSTPSRCAIYKQRGVTLETQTQTSVSLNVLEAIHAPIDQMVEKRFFAMPKTSAVYSKDVFPNPDHFHKVQTRETKDHIRQEIVKEIKEANRASDHMLEKQIFEQIQRFAPPHRKSLMTLENEGRWSNQISKAHFRECIVQKNDSVECRNQKQQMFDRLCDKHPAMFVQTTIRSVPYITFSYVEYRRYMERQSIVVVACN